MFYRALGYAVWKLAWAYLRQRYRRLVKPGAAGAALGVALIAVYVATRNDDE